MLKEINVIHLVPIVAGTLFIFIVINAWHIRILWNTDERRYYIHYKMLHLIHEINHRDHWEFEERKTKLPRCLRIFRWKRTKEEVE